MLKEPSDTQAADIFTKGFANPDKWKEVRDMIDIVDPNLPYWIPKPPKPPVDKEEEKKKRKREHLAKDANKRGDTNDFIDAFGGLSNADIQAAAALVGAGSAGANSLPPLSQPYKCKQCGLVFPSRRALRDHKTDLSHDDDESDEDENDNDEAIRSTRLELIDSAPKHPFSSEPPEHLQYFHKGWNVLEGGRGLVHVARHTHRITKPTSERTTMTFPYRTIWVKQRAGHRNGDWQCIVHEQRYVPFATGENTVYPPTAIRCSVYTCLSLHEVDKLWLPPNILIGK